MSLFAGAPASDLPDLAGQNFCQLDALQGDVGMSYLKHDIRAGSSTLRVGVFGLCCPGFWDEWFCEEGLNAPSAETGIKPPIQTWNARGFGRAPSCLREAPEVGLTAHVAPGELCLRSGLPAPGLRSSTSLTAYTPVQAR